MTQRLQEAGRLFAAGEHAAAEAICQEILAAAPEDFDALHLMGVLLSRQSRPADALRYLAQADAVRPGQELLRINLGNALLANKQFEQAASLPAGDNAQALNNRGLAYLGLRQHQAAEAAFRLAVGIQPDYAPAWFNLATTLTVLDRLEEALDAARTALRAAPPDTPASRLADVTNEIGRLLMALGRPEQALTECRRFLQRYPGEKTVLWNMSLCLLQLGQFEEGWRAYENRFAVPARDPYPVDASVLDLAAVQGKRVLILTEQGRGDMLQFVRYAPALSARGAAVFVQAYPDLVSLLAAMPGVAGVVSTEEPRPEVDFATPVMSLPLAFGTHPSDVPYLRVPSGRQVDLGPRTKLRIGIAWSGSPQSYERSAMPVSVLAPLFALSTFEFHCVQRDILDSDQAWIRTARADITTHHLSDFADTAALITQMDTVIAIDTAVAHLAGGLGKPLKVLLPFSPDWRWLLNRSDSPWYPTAQLFRQSTRNDWTSVVHAVIAALRLP